MGKNLFRYGVLADFDGIFDEGNLPCRAGSLPGNSSTSQ